MMFSTLLERLSEVEVTDDEKYRYFLERTDNHIRLVQEAATKIVNVYPELFELLKRVRVHDASKYEEPELTPYVAITWRHKLEDEEGKFSPIKDKGYQTPGELAREEENEATLHHITSNSHHPEYWNKEEANISNEDRDKSDKCIDASRMPDIAVAEMIADWQAMSEELQENTAREWFDKVKDVRWHFSEHQEELIDKLLRVFEEEGV